MKQLIVCAALLPLLLAFVMQFMLMEQRHAATERAEGAVRFGAAEASCEGGFSDENEAHMRAEISAAFGVSAGSIEMELDRKLGEAGKTVSYVIRVPSGKIIAAPRVFGLSEEGNAGVLTIRGAAPNLLYNVKPIDHELEQ